MTESASSTLSAWITRSRVTGFTPPVASVAPMIERSRQSTSIEHWRK